MDKSKYTYAEMIEQLRNKTYVAPDIWDNIEQELDLGDKLQELPELTAPEGLWEGIEEQLEEAPIEVGTKSGKLRWVAILALGIVIGMILLGSIQLLMQNESDQQFQYKSEVEMASLQDNTIDLDANIEDVLEYIEMNSFLFDEEQLEEFNTQLEEINQALEQLLEMQENYGSDPSSNKLMEKIEREKANLLKSMI